MRCSTFLQVLSARYHGTEREKFAAKKREKGAGIGLPSRTLCWRAYPGARYVLVFSVLDATTAPGQVPYLLRVKVLHNRFCIDPLPRLGGAQAVVTKVNTDGCRERGSTERIRQQH